MCSNTAVQPGISERARDYTLGTGVESWFGGSEGKGRESLSDRERERERDGVSLALNPHSVPFTARATVLRYTVQRCVYTGDEPLFHCCSTVFWKKWPPTIFRFEFEKGANGGWCSLEFLWDKCYFLVFLDWKGRQPGRHKSDAHMTHTYIDKTCTYILKDTYAWLRCTHGNTFFIAWMHLQAHTTKARTIQKDSFMYDLCC